MLFFRKSNARSDRHNYLLGELGKNKDIIYPDRVAEQFMQNEEIVEYQYKDHTLYINNEGSALYHLVNSTNKIEKLVASIDLDICKSVLDVGANTGLFTYFLSQKYPNAFVYLFEPDRRLFRTIEKNLKHVTNYEIVPLAVSDSDDQDVTFYVNPNSAQTNSIVKEAVTIMEDESVLLPTTVKTTTLDSFCQNRNITEIDVLKIDIQGGELGALRRAGTTLTNCNTLLAEVSFFVSDTIDLLELINRYFGSYQPINDVFMGADLKFSKTK